MRSDLSQRACQRAAHQARAGRPCHRRAVRDTGVSPVPKASTFQPLYLCAVFLLSSLLSSPAHAYVEVPFTLGRVVNESTIIVLLRVEKVDKEKNLIVFRKVRDVKG